MSENRVVEPKKAIGLVLLAISAVPVFILPVFGFSETVYWIAAVIVVAAAAVSYRLWFDLFPSILFFAIVHLLHPLNVRFVAWLGISFNGALFFLPVVLFTLLILVFPQIRRTINWWRRDVFDKRAVALIGIVAAVSIIALIIWVRWIAGDLSKFTAKLPNVPFLMVVINGIAFALVNSVVEEYLTRGMLANGFEKIFGNKAVIILLVALFFGFYHYNGFPGGLIGCVMVFVWSIGLGMIRYKTNGLLGVVTAHFLADTTIYIILNVIR